MTPPFTPRPGLALAANLGLLLALLAGWAYLFSARGPAGETSRLARELRRARQEPQRLAWQVGRLAPQLRRLTATPAALPAAGPGSPDAITAGLDSLRQWSSPPPPWERRWLGVRYADLGRELVVAWNRAQVEGSRDALARVLLARQRGYDPDTAAQPGEAARLANLRRQLALLHHQLAYAKAEAVLELAHTKEPASPARKALLQQARAQFVALLARDFDADFRRSVEQVLEAVNGEMGLPPRAFER